MDLWTGPGEALRRHLWLFDRANRDRKWIDTHKGKMASKAEFLAGERRQYFLTFAKTYSQFGLDDGMSTSRVPEPPSSTMFSKANVLIALKLMGYEYDLLNEATTYYVSERMTDLVDAAAKVADSEPLFPTDPPTKSGFAVFERPWTMVDLHPDTGEVVPELQIPIRAVGWYETPVSVVGEPLADAGMGLQLFFYTDCKSYNTVYLPTLAKYNPAIEPIGGDIRDDPMVMDVAPWRYGMSWRPTEDLEDAEDHMGYENHAVVANVGEGRRFMLAFFRLMWQELLVAEPWDGVNRAERKRWARVGRTLPDDGGIKLVKLRKMRRPLAPGFDRPDEDEDSRRWKLDHRIMVRPFWRQQHYPSLGPARLEDGSMNPESHRRIYIEAFPKGPEWAPFVFKHNVTAVTR